VNPLDRLRIEKAAADCGFEMAPMDRDGGLELRSARFPESVAIYLLGEDSFRIATTRAALLDGADDDDNVAVQGWDELYRALKTAASHARTLPNRVADAFRKETMELPRSTEAERVVVQRVGQNLFRAALLDYWQGRCCVTGLDIPELLRASHIKPWAACNGDDERLDVFNGLLLTPSLDALFDAGWVTFRSDGAIQLSPMLSQRGWTTLGVTEAMSVEHLRSEHLPYLDFHRQQVFRSG
jgi:putative restriction endonuclease